MVAIIAPMTHYTYTNIPHPPPDIFVLDTKCNALKPSPTASLNTATHSYKTGKQEPFHPAPDPFQRIKS